MPDSLHKEDSSLSQRISKSMGEETPVGRSKTPVYKFPIHTRRFLFLIQEEATLQDVSENMRHRETLKKSHCPYFFLSHLNSIFLTYLISMLAHWKHCLNSTNAFRFFSPWANMCLFLSFTSAEYSKLTILIFSFCSIHDAFIYDNYNLVT